MTRPRHHLTPVDAHATVDCVRCGEPVSCYVNQGDVEIIDPCPTRCHLRYSDEERVEFEERACDALDTVRHELDFRHLHYCGFAEGQR